MRHLEDAALAGLLLALVVFAGAQIGARQLFDSGWVWADQAIRIGVLWIGLLGAVVASREDRHLKIDVLARVLPPRGQAVVAILAHVVTAGVCAVIAWYAARFVLGEREFGAVGVGGLPAWTLQVVMPAAFALMALRHAAHAVRSVRRW